MHCGLLGDDPGCESESETVFNSFFVVQKVGGRSGEFLEGPCVQTRSGSKWLDFSTQRPLQVAPSRH